MFRSCTLIYHIVFIFLTIFYLNLFPIATHTLIIWVRDYIRYNKYLLYSPWWTWVLLVSFLSVDGWGWLGSVDSCRDNEKRRGDSPKPATPLVTYCWSELKKLMFTLQMFHLNHFNQSHSRLIKNTILFKWKYIQGVFRDY